MTTEVFQDGEPVDPQKLRSLQNQINEISKTADSAYSLSQTTANSVTILKVMHLAAGQVKFPSLKKGANNRQDIPHQWGANYQASYTTATPRIVGSKSITGWAISGQMDSEVLTVYASADVNEPVAFNWMSAGEKKIVPGA
jgi:hypothetical protein